MPPEQTKPRILLITRNLPPLVGGMERLIQNAASGLSTHTELTVIGPRGCTRYLPRGTIVHETPSNMLPFLLVSTWIAVRCSRGSRFDVVLGGSGLVGPTLYLLKRFFGYRTAVCLHGLDLVVDSKAYQSIFVPCLRQLDVFIANSRNTRRLAVEKGMPPERIHIINPGTQLPSIPDEQECAAFRQRHNVDFNKVVLFVGRMTVRKGLSRFIRKGLSGVLAGVPDTGLVVIGDNPDSSLDGRGERASILAATRDTGLTDSINFLGPLEDQDLLTAYALADVLVLPLIAVPGDIEGFGMIAVEAAACGTPTVAFELGGVSDAVTGENGRLVAPGDYTSFINAVVETLVDESPGSESCLEHASRFAWPVYHERLRQLMDQTIQQD